MDNRLPSAQFDLKVELYHPEVKHPWFEQDCVDIERKLCSLCPGVSDKFYPDCDERGEGGKQTIVTADILYIVTTSQ